MKRSLYACLGLLLVGLAAFTGPAKNRCQMTVQTAAGPVAYKTSGLVMFLNPAADEIVFYFKTPMLTSGDKAKDSKLTRLLQTNAYNLLEYKGHLAQSIAGLKVGEHVSTSATGTLNLMGQDQNLQVPVKITRLSETEYAYSCTALLDWAKTKAGLAEGKAQNVQGPIRLEVSHTL